MTSSSNFPLPARLMYNLGDGENWGAIAVNLLPLLAKELQHRGEQQSQHSKAQRQVDRSPISPARRVENHLQPSSAWCLCPRRRVSPLCLSPFFRLLRVCEQKQNQGDLEAIDGLLGEEPDSARPPCLLGFLSTGL